MAGRATQGSALVRVRAETREKLRELADGQSIARLVERLTDEEYRRRQLQAFNDGYARLKADPARWAAFQEEQRELDGTVADGLSDEDAVEWDESLTDAASW